MPICLAMHGKKSQWQGRSLCSRVPGDSSRRGTMSWRHTTCVKREENPVDSIRAASLPSPTMGAAKVQQLMSSPGATSPLRCLQTRGQIHHLKICGLPGEVTLHHT